jgi:hypothetical protein
VAAQEEDQQGVVGVGRGLGGRVERGGRFAAAAGAVGAPVVDQRAGGDGDQPGPGAVRDAVCRPLLSGGEQCLLYGVLAGVELAVPAHEHAEDLRREFAQQAFERLGHSNQSYRSVLQISPAGAARP